MKWAFDLTDQEWKAWVAANGAPAYVAGQIQQWLYSKQVFDPQEFTNLSKPLRHRLIDAFSWKLPTVKQVLEDDASEKLLLILDDGTLIESVLMKEARRTTVCISSQVGCKRGCRFCQTGVMGLTRNLSRGEILTQILLANQRLTDRRVTNVVFMGMGEPLDNFEPVVSAVEVMVDPLLMGLSKHRVTISTVGILPELEELGKRVACSLAISLHSAVDEIRTKIMPINRLFPLSELKRVLLNYPIHTRHGITFEYILIDGVNDSLVDAKRLVTFIHGLKAKINLIPMNPHPGSPFQSSPPDRIAAFQKYFTDRKIPAPVRYSRAQKISGACGQLAAKHKTELDLSPHELRRKRRARFRGGVSAVSD